ncbi:MAG: hypothetical protein ACO3SD_03355 [Gemmatimonadaceae bacterium]|jgi:D-serine deaminase-like pyridoxal phosphate-dependent protein
MGDLHVLPTPSLLVDRARVERNVTRMASRIVDRWVNHREW